VLLSVSLQRVAFRGAPRAEWMLDEADVVVASQMRHLVAEPVGPRKLGVFAIELDLGHDQTFAGTVELVDFPDEVAFAKPVPRFLPGASRPDL
jgi:hypothetical protein